MVALLSLFLTLLISPLKAASRFESWAGNVVGEPRGPGIETFAMRVM